MQLSTIKKFHSDKLIKYINYNNNNNNYNYNYKILISKNFLNNQSQQCIYKNQFQIFKNYYTSSFYDYDDSTTTTTNSSFGYDFNIEIPIYNTTISSIITTNSNNNNNNNSNNNILSINNNNNNISKQTNVNNKNKIKNENENNNINNNNDNKITPTILDKLPKKIKLNKKTLNNILTSPTTTTTTTKTTTTSSSSSSIISNISNKENKKDNTNNNSNNNVNIVNKNENKIYSNIKKNKKNDLEDDSIEIEDFKLTDEQEKIVDLIVNGGKNVFFTGSAGTGKSFILQRLVSELRKKYPKSVFITAATGIAAVNIGGTTLHSFAGIKLGKGSAEKLSISILQSKKNCQRWLDCKVLIIDEISMIDSELFEKLDIIGKTVRGNNLPFGGIQLVLLGDFYQLPPVYGSYAFESEVWSKSVDISIELTKVMRQKDPEFIKILNKLRVGKVFDDTVEFLLKRCQRPLDVSNGVLPTKLYSTNKSVDEENQISLDKLSGDPYQFEAYDSGHPDLLENLDKDCPAPNKLILKIGAQVVLLRKLENHSELVNGSRGVVVGFVKARSKRRFSNFYQNNIYAPVVLFNNGQKVSIPPMEWVVWSEKKASRVQLPLKLAWALTIHRAQGMTLDKVECELSRTFANGQGYVALSRVKSLDGLYLKEFKKSSIKTSYKVINFKKSIN